MLDVFFSNFKLFFVHYLWGMAALLFIYIFYVDNFKVKKESEIPTGDQLIENYVEAKRRGILK